MDRRNSMLALLAEPAALGSRSPQPTAEWATLHSLWWAPLLEEGGGALLLPLLPLHWRCCCCCPRPPAEAALRLRLPLLQLPASAGRRHRLLHAQ